MPRASSEKRSSEASQPKKQPPKVRGKRGGARVQISPAAAGIIYDGDSLDDWDDEELLRGQRRSKNGKFHGRPPVVIPAALHKELTRRRYSRAHDILADSLVDGAQMLRAIVNDSSAEASDRIRAVELMFNRVLGKPRESVSLDLSAESDGPKWQQVVATAIVGSVEEAGLLLERQRGADVVDGEMIMEDDE